MLEPGRGKFPMELDSIEHFGKLNPQLPPSTVFHV